MVSGLDARTTTGNDSNSSLAGTDLSTLVQTQKPKTKTNQPNKQKLGQFVGYIFTDNYMIFHS